MFRDWQYFKLKKYVNSLCDFDENTGSKMSISVSEKLLKEQCVGSSFVAEECTGRYSFELTSVWKELDAAGKNSMKEVCQSMIKTFNQEYNTNLKTKDAEECTGRHSFELTSV